MQRKETPEELDVLRMFYESWHQQEPDAELPIAYCLQHGVFEMKKAVTLAKERSASSWANKLAKKRKALEIADNKNSNSQPKKKKQKVSKTPVKKEKKVKKEESSSEESSSEEDSDDSSSSDDDQPLAV